MRILSVAYPLAPVSLNSVGGAEQVLAMVERAIVAAGHQSVVVAMEGSIVAGRLCAVQRCEGALDESAKRRAQASVRDAIAAAGPVDLIHMHGIDFLEYLPEPGVPVLATLHLPPEWYPSGMWALARPLTYLHCVSEAQQRRCPPGAQLRDPIPNGVDVDVLQPRWRKRGYAIALGRICPEKGFHFALDACSSAGVPLVIGGEVYGYEEHQRYFHEEIEPRLQRGHRYLGPLGLERKRRLLAGARCLVSGSIAPETSSLVAMEALACGTPVAAIASGALPEIIEDGVTGCLATDVASLAAAVRRSAELNSGNCRKAAVERFSARCMTDRYLKTYKEILAN